MTRITNKAYLTYNNGVATVSGVSNTAAAVLESPFTAEKTCLSQTYSANEELVFVLSLTNSSCQNAARVRVSDDLGTFRSCCACVTPLTYEGSAQLYINGIYESELEAAIFKNHIRFTIPLVPACCNAVIIYKARANEYAPLSADSEIINTASWTADAFCEPVTASNTVYASQTAQVQIQKSITPSVITCGGAVLYTFTLFNYGNTDATDIVLTDCFAPVPSSIGVSVDSIALRAGEYSFINGSLTLPCPASSYRLRVPKASFEISDCGQVEVSPGVVTIEVTGML